MASEETHYDPGLTAEIRRALAEWDGRTQEELAWATGLVDRYEGERRGGPTASDGLYERARRFLLGGPPTGPIPPEARAPVSGPTHHALDEMAALSGRLDQAAHPSGVFYLAERTAGRAHEIAEAVETTLGLLDPAHAWAEVLRRVLALLSRLVRNALARLSEFARDLGITSFSVSFASLPPAVTVTLTFGGGVATAPPAAGPATPKSD